MQNSAVSFSVCVDDDVQKVSALIDALKKENELKGLVFDLRGNPGGLLNEAVNTTNLFIESPPCEIISGKYLPKKENSKKQIATITSGTPITRLVDSRRAKIPNDPINNSIGKIN